MSCGGQGLNLLLDSRPSSLRSCKDRYLHSCGPRRFVCLSHLQALSLWVFLCSGKPTITERSSQKDEVGPGVCRLLPAHAGRLISQRLIHMAFGHTLIRKLRESTMYNKNIVVKYAYSGLSWYLVGAQQYTESVSYTHLTLPTNREV